MSEQHTRFLEQEVERMTRRLLAEENYNDILRNETEHLEKDRNNLELRVKALEDELAAVKAERLHAVSTLSEQVDEASFDDRVRERMADILTRTADALHGQAPKDGLHSWHDLPELVVQMRKERDEARDLWCRAVWLSGGLNPGQLAKEKGWDLYDRRQAR